MNSTRAAPNRIKRSTIPRYRQKEGRGTIKKKRTDKKGKIKGGEKRERRVKNGRRWFGKRLIMIIESARWKRE